MRYRNCQFTCFAHENLNFLLIDGEPISPIQFLCFGLEICPTTSKQHLQGYVEFTKQMYMKGIKTLFNDPGLHIEKTINREALIKYNKKEGKYVEFGKPKSNSDWSSLHTNSVYSLISERSGEDTGKFDDIRALLEAKDVIDNHKIELFETEFKNFYSKIELNPIQCQIHDLLIYQNDRQILWIWDEIGGHGKTWFSNYFISLYDAIVLTNGKTRDLATYYNCEEYVIFDFSRTTEGRINYQIIEDLKNGKVFAPKYKSKMKFRLGVKVVCLANFLPDFEALSLDRWSCFWLSPKAGGNTEPQLLEYDFTRV